MQALAGLRSLICDCVPSRAIRRQIASPTPVPPLIGADFVLQTSVATFMRGTSRREVGATRVPAEGSERCGETFSVRLRQRRRHSEVITAGPLPKIDPNQDGGVAPGRPENCLYEARDGLWLHGVRALALAHVGDSAGGGLALAAVAANCAPAHCFGFAGSLRLGGPFARPTTAS